MKDMEAWRMATLNSSKMVKKEAKMMKKHKKCFHLMNKKQTRWVSDSNYRLSKTSFMIHFKRMALKIWKKWVIYSRFVVVVITLLT